MIDVIYMLVILFFMPIALGNSIRAEERTIAVISSFFDLLAFGLTVLLANFLVLIAVVETFPIKTL